MPEVAPSSCCVYHNLCVIGEVELIMLALSRVEESQSALT